MVVLTSGFAGKVALLKCSVGLVYCIHFVSIGYLLFFPIPAK